MLTELLQKYRKVKLLNDFINKEFGNNCKLKLLNRDYRLMEGEEKKEFENGGFCMYDGEPNNIYFDINKEFDEIIKGLLHEHGHIIKGLKNHELANEFQNNQYEKIMKKFYSL